MKNLQVPLLLAGLYCLCLFSCITPGGNNVDAIETVKYSDIQRLIKEEGVILIDVRTPAEIAKGKIGGAEEIDVLAPQFAEKISKLDKKKTYLLYCKSGVRSTNASHIMVEQGFPKVYNLEGGYDRWLEQNAK